MQSMCFLSQQWVNLTWHEPTSAATFVSDIFCHSFQVTLVTRIFRKIVQTFPATVGAKRFSQVFNLEKQVNVKVKSTTTSLYLYTSLQASTYNSQQLQKLQCLVALQCRKASTSFPDTIEIEILTHALTACGFTQFQYFSSVLVKIVRNCDLKYSYPFQIVCIFPRQCYKSR